MCVCGRCGSKGNRSSSEDVGPGREGSGSEYRGAQSCSGHAGLCLSRDGGLSNANQRSPRSPSVPWWCREPAEISTGRTTHITCIPPLNNTQITTDVHQSTRTFIQWQVEAKVEVWLHSYPKKSIYHLYMRPELFSSSSATVLKPDQSPISSLLAIISNKLSYFLLSLCFSAALFLEGASVPPDSHRFLWDANILLGICLWQWHKLGTWISLLCRGADLNFRFTPYLSGPL